MSTESMSPERTRAYYKFKDAEHHAAKHHYDQAITAAREALEIDPTYVEMRHWIAGIYVRTDQPRKASLEYQEILHENRDDQGAWAKLREVDAAAAQRLERLHDIAPDPFVVQRTADNAVSDDLDDLGGLADEFVTEVEEETLIHHAGGEVDALEDLEGTDAVTSLLQGDVGAVPLGAAGSRVGAADNLDDLDADAFIDFDAIVTEEEPVAVAANRASAATAQGGAVPAASASAPKAVAPKPAAVATAELPSWLYEEDLKYREKMANHPVYAALWPRVVEFWKEDGPWDTAISGSVHLDEHRHPEIVQVCREVEAKMGTPKWTLYVCPERRMISCITRGAPPTISLTTGVLNHLSHDEQLFVVGRFTTMLKVGHVPFIQMAMLTLERSPRTITDVEIDMLELLKRHHGGWDAGVHREDRIKLGALCHAWQQRAELTADRGGLICCRDLEVACNGIAKTVAADGNAAQTCSWKALMEKYKGQDAGQLAAIPPKEDPVRNEGYGVYRVQMLRWWANTPAGKATLQA